MIAPIAAEAPVVTGEFGETDCQTRPKSFMDWADHHGVGYLMWAWWVLPDSACSTSRCSPTSGARPGAERTALRRTCSAGPRLSLGGGGTQRSTRPSSSASMHKACFAVDRADW